MAATQLLVGDVGRLQLVVVMWLPVSTVEKCRWKKGLLVAATMLPGSEMEGRQWQEGIPVLPGGQLDHDHWEGRDSRSSEMRNYLFH